MKRAGFRTRAVATGLDVLIGFGVAAAVTFVAGSSLPPDESPAATYVMEGVAWASLLGYSALEAVCPAAVGKRVLRLRILSQSGADAGAGQRWIRWTFKMAPVLLLAVSSAWMRLHDRWFPPPAGSAVRALVAFTPLLLTAGATVAVVGGSLMIFGPRRQSLYDHVARTAVYEPGDPPAARAFEPLAPSRRSKHQV